MVAFLVFKTIVVTGSFQTNATTDKGFHLLKAVFGVDIYLFQAVYMIDSFLKPKGRRSLLFFYQELDLDGSSKYYDKLRKEKIASIDKYKKE